MRTTMVLPRRPFVCLLAVLSVLTASFVPGMSEKDSETLTCFLCSQLSVFSLYISIYVFSSCVVN